MVFDNTQVSTHLYLNFIQGNTFNQAPETRS